MNAYMLKWYDVLIPLYSPESKLWNCEIVHFIINSYVSIHDLG